MCGVGADVCGILPAALALFAGGMCSSNTQTLNSGSGTTLALDQFHMGNDHQVSQLIHGNAVQQVIDGIIAVQGNGSFQRSTDGLFCTGLLQHLLDLVTDSNELCPLGLEGIVCSVLACLGHCSNTTYLFMPSVLGRKSQISWLVKQRMGAMILSRATRILYMVV